MFSPFHLRQIEGAQHRVVVAAHRNLMWSGWWTINHDLSSEFVGRSDAKLISFRGTSL
jgi:hypothetical protein